MNNFYDSLCFTSLMAIVFIAFAIHLQYRTRQKIQHFYKQNNEFANSYVELQNNCHLLEQGQMEHLRATRSIIHDLRSPIAGIVSASKLMQMDGTRTEDDEKLLSLIEKSGSSASVLIGEILNGKTELQRATEPSDLYEILDTCTYLLNFQATEKSQKIILEGNPIRLFINKEKIRRVIINLVSNAIKFSFENSCISVGLHKVNNKAVISIQDQGMGIPNIIGQNIFEGSIKNGRLGTANEESFGLGLSISKQIVEEHGGRIWFENNNSRGSTFFVALPLIA